MAASVSASFSMGDVSQQRLLQRPTHPHQSILPLRRERTILTEDFSRKRDTNPVYSQQLPVRSAAFSGGMNDASRFLFPCGQLIVCSLEKQYDRRQASSQARSAKSDEVDRRIVFFDIDERLTFCSQVFNLIDRRLQTGVHGVRHMFRSNDPSRDGRLSR